MKRRDFLRAAAVGVGAVSAQGGCATVPASRGDRFSTDRLDAFMDQFDHGLAAIDRGRGLGAFTAPADEQGARGEAMAKRALRSLYAVGAFADLEVEEQAHPGVQARMAQMLPEMAESLRESAELLDSATPEERTRVRETLRNDPSLPLQLAEAVEDAGDAAGVSARTRRKFRAMATHVGFRLRHHDPSVLAGEYVAKVRKIEAWSGDEARLQRQIAARVGEAALLEHQARFAAARERWSEILGPEGSGGGEVEQPWKRSLRTAGWCFGLGVVVGGIGAIMVASNVFAGVFPITAGAILVTVALVMLLVAGIQAAVHSGEPSDQRGGRPEGT